MDFFVLHVVLEALPRPDSHSMAIHFGENRVFAGVGKLTRKFLAVSFSLQIRWR